MICEVRNNPAPEKGKRDTPDPKKSQGEIFCSKTEQVLRRGRVGKTDKKPATPSIRNWWTRKKKKKKTKKKRIRPRRRGVQRPSNPQKPTCHEKKKRREIKTTQNYKSGRQIETSGAERILLVCKKTQLSERGKKVEETQKEPRHSGIKAWLPKKWTNSNRMRTLWKKAQKAEPTHDP